MYQNNFNRNLFIIHLIAVYLLIIVYLFVNCLNEMWWVVTLYIGMAWFVGKTWEKEKPLKIGVGDKVKFTGSARRYIGILEEGKIYEVSKILLDEDFNLVGLDQMTVDKYDFEKILDNSSEIS